MEKKHEIELLYFLTEKGRILFEDFKNLKLGPVWDYKIVDNDQLKNSGYFRIIEVDNNKNYFCTYTVEEDKLAITDFAVCSLVKQIDTLTDLLDRKERIDATGEVIFWPYKGYWMRILETNDFWKLTPDLNVKQSEEEFWNNKNM